MFNELGKNKRIKYDVRVIRNVRIIRATTVLRPDKLLTKLADDGHLIVTYGT